MKISLRKTGDNFHKFAQEVPQQLKFAVSQKVHFRLSPLGFLFQGPQTLVAGGYKLSKHRHHVTRRTNGFCENSALGCRQYRPHGSGLSNQREEMVGEEGKGLEKTQSQSKCLPLLTPGLLFLLSVPFKWPLASSSFQAGLLDGALGISEGKPDSSESFLCLLLCACPQVVGPLADR